jgi:hypothetical protein
MGAGIAAVLAATEPVAGPGPGLDPADWERAARRLDRYLAALGVAEAALRVPLAAQVQERLIPRAAAAPLEDPVEAAIEEANALLDLWLHAELGPESDPDALFQAKAAVLGGAVPGWGARWAGLAEGPVGPAIRAMSLPAVPEPSPLTMEDSTIDLFFHRLGCRIAGLVNRLLCRPGAGQGAGGGCR